MKNQLENVRGICAEFAKMLHRIFIFLAQNSDNSTHAGAHAENAPRQSKTNSRSLPSYRRLPQTTTDYHRLP